jgi:hypothetical protein
LPDHATAQDVMGHVVSSAVARRDVFGKRRPGVHGTARADPIKGTKTNPSEEFIYKWYVFVRSVKLVAKRPGRRVDLRGLCVSVVNTELRTTKSTKKT